MLALGPARSSLLLALLSGLAGLAGGGARAEDRPAPPWTVPPAMFGENDELAPYALRYQRFEDGVLVGLYPNSKEARAGSSRRAWVEEKSFNDGRCRERHSAQMFPEADGTVRFRCVEMEWRQEDDGEEGGLHRVQILEGRVEAAFDGRRLAWSTTYVDQTRWPGERQKLFAPFRRVEIEGQFQVAAASWGQRRGGEAVWRLMLRGALRKVETQVVLRRRAPDADAENQRLVQVLRDEDGKEHYVVARSQVRVRGSADEPRGDVRFEVVHGEEERWPDAWFRGTHLAALGDSHGASEEDVAHLDRQCRVLEETATRGDWDLAEAQAAVVLAGLAELEARRVPCGWIRVPTAPAHDRLLRLRSARAELEQQYFEAIEAKQSVERHLLALREAFSTNVVRSMLRSALTWLNAVPTDPVAGLAEYSDLTAAVALPGTVLGWRDAAKEDAALLGDQARALREAKRAQRELDAFVQATVEARRAIFERMRARQEERVEPLHRRLLEAAR